MPHGRAEQQQRTADEVRSLEPEGSRQVNPQRETQRSAPSIPKTASEYYEDTINPVITRFDLNLLIESRHNPSRYDSARSTIDSIHLEIRSDHSAEYRDPRSTNRKTLDPSESDEQPKGEQKASTRRKVTDARTANAVAFQELQRKMAEAQITPKDGGIEDDDDMSKPSEVPNKKSNSGQPKLPRKKKRPIEVSPVTTVMVSITLEIALVSQPRARGPRNISKMAIASSGAR